MWRPDGVRCVEEAGRGVVPLPGVRTRELRELRHPNALAPHLIAAHVLKHGVGRSAVFAPSKRFQAYYQRLIAGRLLARQAPDLALTLALRDLHLALRPTLNTCMVSVRHFCLCGLIKERNEKEKTSCVPLGTHEHPKHFKMLCKLWDAAANDTVGGREPHKGPKGVSKALMERYSGMGKAERKSHLAALK